MKKIIRNIILLTIVLFNINIFPQQLLQSGPMAGFSAMREVSLWVQTNKFADVKFVYWNLNDVKKKYETAEVATKEIDGYTAKIAVTNLEPGQKYNYELYINKKKISLPYELKFQTQELWQWRKDPPKFNFITGSCFYVNEPQYDRPGKPYGSNFEILKSIYDKRADFMLWLGDNLYLREVDWDSWSGILKRYTHTRSFPQLQPLLASMHHYATWDDHDFGPNDSDRGYTLKDKTLSAFKLFWPNPSYGINGKPGITSFFQWGDVEFFLLDDRYYRTPNDRRTGEKEMFGSEQIEWLIDNLVKSRAPFKIIATGGQILNPVEKDYLEIFNRFPKEKEKLLNLLSEEKIEGVIFLTGDRHHSEITKLEREGSYPLYDFTISSFTAGVSPGKDELNTLRVSGTLADEHNFALFNVSGKSKERILKCTVFDKNGKAIWDYSINENELKIKK
ncbi:MAG: phosphodiesterase [Ignavibacteriae bacterium HGW-Ignavibacteriae-3]|nr:MAG: phosphodiesterase [Ignavibacteriae bacterium HGW-Ignavibacteriae-3]